MPLTVHQLYIASTLSPGDFGAEVVSIDADDTTKLQQAIAACEQPLQFANAEVALPVRQTLDDFASPLDNEGLIALFGAVAPDVRSLWDAAETSFGRSELRKRVDADDYDEKSDQDRIQGNQRLQKLLDFLKSWLASRNGEVATTTNDGIQGSGPIAIAYSW